MTSVMMFSVYKKVVRETLFSHTVFCVFSANHSAHIEISTYLWYNVFDK